MQFFLAVAGIAGIIIGVLFMSLPVVVLGTFILCLMVLFDKENNA